MLHSRVAQVGLVGGFLISSVTPVLAAPPPPSGPHPRLFLSTAVRAAFTQAAGDSKSAMANMVKACQAAVQNPSSAMGSGYAGFDWAFLAVNCAASWQITNNADHAAMGIKIWRALMEDIDTIGDKKACVAGAAETAGVASIRRDSGYVIRSVGYSTALAYDWLHDAPGVTEALRQQTRDCFRHWITFYTREGYLNTQPGANYHAGYVGAKTLIAIAEGSEDGASGDTFWTQAVDDVFGKQIVANGLAQDNGGVPRGGKHGALVGGDWPEGWQYGPLSVTEYAFSARALEEQGVDLPALSAWASDLTLRQIYGLLPDRSGVWVGGDAEAGAYFVDPNTAPFEATRLGPGSDQAASWAAFMIQGLVADGVSQDGAGLWQALAQARAVAPADPLQTALPTWYLARGTRNLYVRSAWDAAAFWAVFSSAPKVVDDHQHLDASNFVFVRGGDALVVDPTPYGSRSTLQGNAVTVQSNVVTGDYQPSQTPWGLPELTLARGTASGVVAARSDVANAFKFQDTPSDIKLARRDWVFLPEGEIVTIDRVRTPSANHKAYLRFRTPGTLTTASDSPLIARAPVGGSALAIHAVKLVPAMAPVFHTYPMLEDCGTVPFGACRTARVAVNEYAWEVPGPDVLAIHVLDGLAQGEAPSDVAPVDAPPIDTDAAENAGVVGASVFRAQKQTFVIEPAALPGPTAVTYGVPGGNPSRHVVFDAPADATAHTTVTATAAGERCRVTLTAGPGVASAPAIFVLASASDGCTVSEDADVPPGRVSPGSGGFDHPGGIAGPGNATSGGKGTVVGSCACRAGAVGAGSGALLALTAAGALLLGWRSRRRYRGAAEGGGATAGRTGTRNSRIAR